MLNDSPYTNLKHRKDNLLHLGFDYRNQILKRTMSNQMFRSNSTLTRFLQYVNDIIYELIENVKHIKTHANPAMDKNQRTLN